MKLKAGDIMIKDFLGVDIEYEKWDSNGQFPLYITLNYSFYLAKIVNKKFMLVLPLSDELPTTKALKKQLVKIQELCQLPVALQLESISNYRRKSFIRNQVPFLTNNQIFLPFLGTFLTNQAHNKASVTVEKFRISTQLLFLYYLYNDTKEIYLADATKDLPYSAMTVSRSVQQLAATELFEIRKEGVNKIIQSKYDKRELFYHIQRYLVSPVSESGYIFKNQLTEKMKLSGESLLSEYTMLSPSRIPTYAIAAQNFDSKYLHSELIDDSLQVKLELWHYDPIVFGSDGNPDWVSVILSLADTTDPRIEEAVDEIINKELG